MKSKGYFSLAAIIIGVEALGGRGPQSGGRARGAMTGLAAPLLSAPGNWA